MEYVFSKDYFLRTDFSIYNIAQKFDMSSEEVCQILSDELGTCDLKHIVRQIRIDVALELLAFSMPMLQVARECGYRSCISFLIDFYKEKRTTPYCWKRKVNMKKN